MINKKEMQEIMADIDTVMGKDYSAKTPEVMAAIISAQLQKNTVTELDQLSNNSTAKPEDDLSYDQPIADIHDRRSAKR